MAPLPCRRTFLILVLASLLPSTIGFLPQSKKLAIVTRSRFSRSDNLPSPRSAVNDDGSHGDADGVASRPSRRDVLSGFAFLTASQITFLFIEVPAVSAETTNLGTADRPIAIIGGGGRTGMEVAEALAGSEGMMHAVTMTRSGKDPFRIIKLPTEVKDRLRHFPESVDVRDADAVLKALQEINASGVIFAASASKQGGNARDVDDIGVGNVAKAAKATGSRLVLVSALALDRPESKSYRITNDLGGYLDKIMDAKFDGENKVRSIMGPDGDYVIVRPGPLLSGRTKGGAVDLELNQGDTIGGGLSRDELAGVAVGALKSGKKGVTVEAYRKRTATKLQPEFAIPSGNELTATSYVGLFDKAKRDE